jgi:hypothetical protein
VWSLTAEHAVKRPFAFIAAVALVQSACTGGSSPAAMDAAPEAAYFSGASLSTLRSYFQERTLACPGPGLPFPDLRDFLCFHDFEDGSRVEVRIVADEHGVTQIVGVATSLEPEESAAWASEVAAVVVEAGDQEELERWAFEQASEGGVRAFGSVAVELQRHSSHRAVVVTPAPR